MEPVEGYSNDDNDLSKNFSTNTNVSNEPGTYSDVDLPPETLAATSDSEGFGDVTMLDMEDPKTDPNSAVDHAAGDNTEKNMASPSDSSDPDYVDIDSEGNKGESSDGEVDMEEVMKRIVEEMKKKKGKVTSKPSKAKGKTSTAVHVRITQYTSRELMFCHVPG